MVKLLARQRVAQTPRRRRTPSAAKLLHAAAREGDVNRLRAQLAPFVSGGAGDTKVSVRYKGQTALHTAAAHGKAAAVRLLLESGAGIEVKDTLQQSPLHVAAANGRGGTVRMLMEIGASVHTRDADDETPLHAASRNGHVNTVRALLKGGADANAVDAEGHTAMALATWNGHDGVVRTLLKFGAETNAGETDGRVGAQYHRIDEHRPWWFGGGGGQTQGERRCEWFGCSGVCEGGGAMPMTLDWPQPCVGMSVGEPPWAPQPVVQPHDDTVCSFSLDDVALSGDVDPMRHVLENGADLATIFHGWRWE